MGNQMPEEDPSQDWTLHSATEDGSCTVLTFSRVFDTCDPQDYPITVNVFNKLITKKVWGNVRQNLYYTCCTGKQNLYNLGVY